MLSHDLSMNVDTLISYGIPKSKMLLVSLLVWLLQAVTQDLKILRVQILDEERHGVFKYEFELPYLLVNRGWKLLIACC